MTYKTSVFGVVITVIAGGFFTFLLFDIVGWWNVVLGPFCALLAARPHEGSDKWLWHKEDAQ